MDHGDPTTDRPTDVGRRKPTRAEKLFDPDVEEGSIAAYELRAFLGRLARHPRVRFVRLNVGAPAEAGTIASARRDRYTPADVVGFCRVMDGIRFRWRIAGDEVDGRLEVPSLREMRANRACGVVLEEDGDELSRTARVVDVAATGTLRPMCLDGDFGCWDRHNGCFQPMASFSEYLRTGIAHLFAGDWQGAAFDSEPSEESARAGALLGTLEGH